MHPGAVSAGPCSHCALKDRSTTGKERTVLLRMVMG